MPILELFGVGGAVPLKYIQLYIFEHEICDTIKQNESEVGKYDFCFLGHFLFGYCVGFNLVKTPQRLGNWFQRYKQNYWSNYKKQKKLSALFGCILTGGNWQKWKRVFLTCPCHEIYRDEAVGLKSCKNTWKIMIFVKIWNLGQYRENLISCQ